MNFGLIVDIASGKSTLIKIYTELELNDNIETAMEPFIDIVH
jgi:hypothetical protein